MNEEDEIRFDAAMSDIDGIIDELDFVSRHPFLLSLPKWARKAVMAVAR